MQNQMIANRLCIFLCCISLIYSMGIKLNADRPSFTARFLVKGAHTLSVISSGQEHHDILVTVLNQAKVVLYNQTGNDLSYTNNFTEGHIKIIFTMLNSQEVNVFFDLVDNENPLAKIIQKKDLKVIEKVLTQVYQSFITISRNQQFHIERDESHKSTLEKSQNHIKWAGIIKIVFLLSSALVQLWIMKGFFNKNQAYQPVDTS